MQSHRCISTNHQKPISSSSPPSPHPLATTSSSWRRVNGNPGWVGEGGRASSDPFSFALGREVEAAAGVWELGNDG